MPQHFGSDPADIGSRYLDSNPGLLMVKIKHLGGGLRSLSTD